MSKNQIKQKQIKKSNISIRTCDSNEIVCPYMRENFITDLDFSLVDLCYNFHLEYLEIFSVLHNKFPEY